MRFLSSFWFCSIMRRFWVFFSILADDLIFCGLYGKLWEIYRISSHVSNMSCLVKLLCDLHRSRYRKSELSTSFLLKCWSSKRCWWTLFSRTYRYTIYLITRTFESFKELERFSFWFKLFIECRRESLVWRCKKGSNHLIKTFTIKSLNFSLPFNNELHGNRLNSSSWKSGFNLFPKHRWKLKSDQPI